MHWSEVGPAPDVGLRLAAVGEGREVGLVARAIHEATHHLQVEAEAPAVECGSDEFTACIARLTECRFRGAFIGNPFKPEAAKLAKQFFVVRHGLGGANALKLGKDVYAQNTEVPAFTNLIRDLKPGLALVMGSGRAARSAVMSLFDSGWRVRVWNRNIIRSRPFAVVFEAYGKVELVPQPDPIGCSLIVNATPVGARPGEQPPINWTQAAKNTTAIDFVYRGVPTEFLRSAALRGFKTVDGRELLVEQAALALEWWLGEPVPRVSMFQAIGFRKL